MKTDTQQRILAYIKENNEVRAKEIIKHAGFSPQAVFRHLQKLLQSGQIKKTGAPPKVYYKTSPIIGERQPNLVANNNKVNALKWASDSVPQDTLEEYFCPSADIWQGRFSRLAPALIKNGFSEATAALIASAIGEVGDNCFAHNAPNWIDVRGCWFEYAIKKGKFFCVVADRGRGILASLKAVRPELFSHREALLTALTERVTGRAPERRGNGLKYTTAVLAELSSGDFLLKTGDAYFECALPLDRNKIAEYIKETDVKIRGTYCEINLTLSYAN